jgi:hypothetical protein
LEYLAGKAVVEPTESLDSATTEGADPSVKMTRQLWITEAGALTVSSIVLRLCSGVEGLYWVRYAGIHGLTLKSCLPSLADSALALRVT